MGKQARLWGTAGAFALACVLLPMSALAGDPDVFRHPVYGGADAQFGTCTLDLGSPPPAGTVCTDNYVIMWQGTGVLGGGPVGPPNVQWHVYAETVRVEFDGSDDEPEVTLLRQGEAVLDDGPTSDQQHLTTASATVAIPMTDGSTYHFSGTWVAWSDRLVFGNDGPATNQDHHYADRCVTLVANGHQKFRFAHMSGTLNGAPIQSYADFDFAAAIFNNDFQYITVQHGGSGCG